MPGLITNPTLGTLRSAARSIIDESSATFWTDAELNVWINEAVRDIARRAEIIQSFNTTINTVAGTGKYPLPADFIRAHRMEFVPTGSQNTYPLRHSTYAEMDQVWGINQTTQQSYPQFFVIWGTPGGQVQAVSTLMVQLFPVPSQAGVLNLFYYRHAQVMTGDGDAAEIPVGWDDAVVAYVEYKAKRKDRDPDWQQAKQEYEDKIEQMVDVTRQWHDQQRMFISPTGSMIPYWLYADEGW